MAYRYKKQDKQAKSISSLELWDLEQLTTTEFPYTGPDGDVHIAAYARHCHIGDMTRVPFEVFYSERGDDGRTALVVENPATRPHIYAIESYIDGNGKYVTKLIGEKSKYDDSDEPLTPDCLRSLKIMHKQVEKDPIQLDAYAWFHDLCRKRDARIKEKAEAMRKARNRKKGLAEPIDWSDWEG